MRKPDRYPKVTNTKNDTHADNESNESNSTIRALCKQLLDNSD